MESGERAAGQSKVPGGRKAKAKRQAGRDRCVWGGRRQSNSGEASELRRAYLRRGSQVLKKTGN